MVALRESRGTMEDYDASILVDCFYSKVKCNLKAQDVFEKCRKENPEPECEKMRKKALLRYCSRPMRYEEFCEVLLGTATTTPGPSTTTTMTTTTTQTTKNPLLKTQYMVSYGAIGGVFVIMLIGSLICWLCNRRSEKKRQKEEEEWKILGFGGGGGSTSTGSASKTSDVEKGTSTKSKTGKTNTKKPKTTSAEKTGNSTKN